MALSPLVNRLLNPEKPSGILTPSQVHKTLRGRIHQGTEKAYRLRGYKPQKRFDSEAKALLFAKRLVESYDRFSDREPDPKWVILGRVKGDEGIWVMVRSGPALNPDQVKATPRPQIQNRLDEVKSRRSQLFRDMDRLESSGIGDRVWAEMRDLNTEKAVLEAALQVKG